MRALLLLSLVLASCSPGTDVATTSTSAEENASTSTTTTTAATTTSSSPQVTTAAETDHRTWYLVSVTASLPEGLSEGLESIAGVDAVTTASVATLHLVRSIDADGSIVHETAEEFTIPLETQVFDPPGRSGFVPPPIEQVLADLGHGEVVLSESSSSLRRLDTGGQLVLEDGTRLLVVGVVADEWVGQAEAVVSQVDAGALGVTNERYAVVRHDGSRTELERDANALVDATVRVRTRDEVNAFRHADAVASQLAVKARYGEFAYRSIGGGAIKIDPAWEDANIVHEHIPLLGGVTCHREFLAMLRETMTALEAAGHEDAIDRSAYKGCWNPRFIRGRTDLSHHAWGAAADINFGNDLDGPGSPTDQRLLDAMAKLDILSGHAWTDPDPGHFEWFPPAR